MLVHQEGQLQLGAHTVGAGDQNRALHVLHIWLKQAAKAAQAPQNAGDVGGSHQGLDAVDCLVTGSYVHAGGGVGIGFGNIAHLYNLRIEELISR